MAEQNFEKSLDKLERIVEEMEQGQVDLDGMLKKFEEGMKLATFCNKKLDQAQKKIELLVKKPDGSVGTTEFTSSSKNDNDVSATENKTESTENAEEQDLF